MTDEVWKVKPFRTRELFKRTQFVSCRSVPKLCSVDYTLQIMDFTSLKWKQKRQPILSSQRMPVLTTTLESLWDLWRQSTSGKIMASNFGVFFCFSETWFCIFVQQQVPDRHDIECIYSVVKHKLIVKQFFFTCNWLNFWSLALKFRCIH